MTDTSKLEVGDTAPSAQDDQAGHGPGREGNAQAHAHGGIFGSNTELIFALICGALLIVGFAMEKLASSAPQWLPVACYIAA